MGWKQAYADNRRQKELTDPAYRERRKAQGAPKDRDARKAYMENYRKANPDKWERTPEQQAEINKRRREKYAADKKHREKIKSQVKKWQAENPDARKRQRIRKYGLTLTQFRKMMEEADHKCQICGHSDQSDPNMFPVIDHCHDTGKVRGVLCMNCNMGIGKLRDSVSTLEAAIAYLRRSQNS